MGTAAAGFGMVAARFFGLSRDFGFLTGCATGVCGAAAAMATSAVLPRHPNSDRDLAFAVMGVNFISTITMVVYPTLHAALVKGMNATESKEKLAAVGVDVMTSPSPQALTQYIRSELALWGPVVKAANIKSE